MAENINQRFQIALLKSGRYAVVECWEVNQGVYCHPDHGDIIKKFNTAVEAGNYIDDNTLA